jgi:hypothetical protein
MGEEAENTSIMEDIAAAWEEHEQESESEAHEETGKAPDGAESGEDVPLVEVAEEVEEEPSLREKSEVQENVVETSEVEAVATEDKAPAGLPPEAREVWNDTPPAMRDAIAKREKDFAAGIQKYAEGAKRAEAMDRTLAPYAQLFAINGGPQNIMPGVLQTASTLQMGTPQQKAATIANLIKQFDVSITDLDTILIGEQPQTPAQPAPAQQDVHQAVAQVLARERQQQQLQMQGTALQQFGQDPKNEFYNDVKGDMADYLEMRARYSDFPSLEEAYNRACLMNDNVRNIIEARKSQANQQRKAAASSISGTPGAPQAQSEPGSIREAIEMAMAQQERG